jgi:hypothetical protein
MPRDFLTKKKKFGIYYTPSEATEILCEWAIKNPKDKILEPSFGACGFLEASRDRLFKLNNAQPAEQLFGSDVDPNAFTSYLYPKFPNQSLETRFFNKDFLSLSPLDFPVSEFDVVLGNPPYVSYHNMTPEQRKSIELLGSRSEIKFNNRASLWAYFVIHGLNFLTKGGRIAWVLPGSFLHSKYSSSVREIISRNFSHSLAIQVGQRIFSSEGTDEKTIILLADGWKDLPKTPNLRIEFASSLKDLKNVVLNWQSVSKTASRYQSRSAYSLLSKNTNRAIKAVEDAYEIIRLGDVANILIGIVTGANHFFIINKETAQKHNFPERVLSPILSRFCIAKGIELTKKDIESVRDEGFPNLLIDTHKVKRRPRSVITYLESFPEEDRKKNITFTKKRKIWYQPNDGRIPDAFFPYMHHQGPRLIINNASVTSTNTIHRVFFSNEAIGDYEKKLLTISLQTTFSQLSAELEGRVYGSGALKHEPSEAKNIKIIWNQKINPNIVNKAYKIIDSLIRQARIEDARRIADRVLMNGYKSKNFTSEISALEVALIEARKRRYDSEK